MRVLALILVLVAVSPPLQANLELSELEARELRGKISVSFRLLGAFDREGLTEKLQSGLPTVFAFEIQLVRKRHNWFDSTVASSTIEVAATFNSLTREYLLNYRRDEKLVLSETYRDLDKLKTAMTSFVEKDLFDSPDGRIEGHRVRVRSEILSEIAFFIVPRKVGTDWRACRIARDEAQR